MVFRKKKRGDIGKHKFCPVCGNKLEIDDGYCTQCGYSFKSRRKKRKVKWRNLLFILIILIIIYLGIRIFSGQPLIPENLSGIFNLANLTGPKKP